MGASHWYTPSPVLGPLATATFVLVLFGGFFLGLWWRDREPGLQWISASLWVSSTFYACETLGLVRRPSRHIGPIWAACLIELSIVFFVVGLATFLNPTEGIRRRSTSLALVPPVAMALLHLAQIPIVRVWGNSMFVLSNLVMSAVVWRARLVEPKAGYGMLAVCLLALPTSYAAMLLLGIDVVLLRYVSVLSRILVAMTLLVVCMHRRRMRLEAELGRRRAAEDALATANATLEATVAARTAELSDLVDGLETFNRNVSHDLRGPLGNISGLAEMAAIAARTGDAERLQKWLSMIERETFRAADLVGAMLELARVGHTEVQVTSVAMDEVVFDVVEDLRLRRASSTLPEVRVHRLPTVEADPRLLRVVYTNLLSNACKFLQGRPEARVDIGAERRDGEVTFFVLDNGPGFDVKVAAKLFEPFQRLHGGAFDGHGVGLSIVRRAVERHGGRIWADGIPDRGACFYFTVPERRGAGRRPERPLAA